jgi:hypothetical protein
MQFLIQRGHNRLVPHGGLAEFPDAILNAKRLDLYNLYKEVILDCPPCLCKLRMTYEDTCFGVLFIDKVFNFSGGL